MKRDAHQRRSYHGAIITFTHRATIFSGGAAGLDRMRRAFRQNHHVRLPGLIDGRLLAHLRERIGRARFRSRVLGDDEARELCMDRNAALRLLHLLTNDPKWLGHVSEIVGAPVSSFTGRVYRMTPGRGHYLTWHPDTQPIRQAAMTVNLGPPYAGGLLEIRSRRTRRILQRLANTGPGGAVLFRVAAPLQHRLTPVDGEVSKTAFTGFFQSRPAFRLPSSRPSPGSRTDRTDRRVRISGAIVSRSFGDRTVLVDTRNDTTHILDAVGGRVWALLHRRRELPDVLAALRREYDADAKTLRRDVLDLIAGLRRRRLIE